MRCAILCLAIVLLHGSAHAGEALLKIAHLQSNAFERYIVSDGYLFGKTNSLSPGLEPALDVVDPEKALSPVYALPHIEEPIGNTIQTLLPSAGALVGRQLQSDSSAWNKFILRFDEAVATGSYVLKTCPGPAELEHIAFGAPGRPLELLPIKNRNPEEGAPSFVRRVTESQFFSRLRRPEAASWLLSAMRSRSGVGMLVIRRENDTPTDALLVRLDSRIPSAAPDAGARIRLVLGWETQAPEEGGRSGNPLRRLWGQ